SCSIAVGAARRQARTRPAPLCLYRSLPLATAGKAGTVAQGPCSACVTWLWFAASSSPPIRVLSAPCTALLLAGCAEALRWRTFLAGYSRLVRHADWPFIPPGQVRVLGLIDRG